MNDVISKDVSLPPEHEDAFATFYLAHSALRVRLGMMAAVLIFAMATAADLRVMPEEVLAWSVPVRLLFMCPLLLALSWVASDPSRYRWHFPAALAVCIMGGAVVSGIVLHLQVLDHIWDMQRVCLMTFGIYVVSGLRAKVAVGTGLLLLGGVAAAEIAIGDGTSQVVRSLVSLTAANLLGATAAFAIERSMRENFLARLRLTEVAERDGLTGLFNRRHLDEHLVRIHRQAIRDDQNLAVALIDIDEFKQFNDSQGHLAGDQCLREVAGALRDCAHRPLDLVSRYGGEEFCLVWYAAERESVPILVEKCRQAVESLEKAHPASTVSPFVTVSCGAAVAPASERSIEEFLAAADEALYKAKDQGRNRAVLN